MNDEDILSTLRAEQRRLKPVALADLLGRLTGGLSQSTLVFYFKRAFPSIPLRVLIETGAWSRVGSGCLSDDQFNELLNPWLGN
ncbi:hypothetical protein [Myxococcus xanthus]|uniref:hypothetical protein n=1 Tax=Myxococcus xanthus TaxID=34 RepID=UPI00112A4392|nr:hypothetical protein [Myxococcus xanthus]